MKGYALLPIAIVGVLADPTLQEPPTLVERDLATVTSVIASVQSQLGVLDTAVKGFTSDPSQVTSASASLLETLRSGTTAVTGSSELSLADALALQSTVGGLQTAGETLVADLEAKKPQFEQAALCQVVLGTTTEIGTASQGLIDAVVAKVPEAAQGIAGQLTAGVIATLNQGKAAFAEGNCTNAAGGGGSGGGGGGSASSPAPAPSTSAPSPPATTSAGGGSGGGGGGAVTVTVTAPGVCGTTTVTSRRTTPVPVPTTGRNSTILPTATSPPVVTAGAIAKGAVNVGAMLGMVAAAIAL